MWEKFWEMLKNSGKQWKILGNSAQNLSKNSDLFWLGERIWKFKEKTVKLGKTGKLGSLETLIGELEKIWEYLMKHPEKLAVFKIFQSFSKLIYHSFSEVFLNFLQFLLRVPLESSVAFHYFPEFFNIFQNIPIRQFYKIFSSFPEIFIEFSTSFQNFLNPYLINSGCNKESKYL